MENDTNPVSQKNGVHSFHELSKLPPNWQEHQNSNGGHDQNQKPHDKRRFVSKSSIGAQDTSVLSSVYGRIEQIVLSYPGDLGLRPISEDSMKWRFGAYFRAFGYRVQFVIIAQFSIDMNNPKSVSENRKRAIRAFDHALLEFMLDPLDHIFHLEEKPRSDHEFQFGNTEFLIDSFIVTKSKQDETFILGPPSWARFKDLNIANQVAKATSHLIRPLKFDLSAGNFLFGDVYGLVGYRTIEEIQRIHYPDHSQQEGEKKLLRQLKSDLGLSSLIPIGNRGEEPSNQPESHIQPLRNISSFMNLAGKSKSGNEVILVGRVDSSYIVGDQEKQKNEIAWLESSLNEIAENFTEIHLRFPSPKFEVYRVPILIKVREDSKKPLLVCSYSEVLIESYQNSRKVYLPSYSSTKLDVKSLEKRIENLYSLLGFKVFWITNSFEDYATNGGGSLGSLVKVIKRSPS